MSRKHYEQIASALSRLRPTMTWYHVEAYQHQVRKWKEVCQDTATFLASSPRFNRDRFLAACNFDGEDNRG